jgi:pseudaminic acid cytidylyltransferase
MLTVTKRIAILPARGGSKRIPRKNIRDFCGKPIIAYPLHAAHESGLFDVIHVSTDDDEIAAVVGDLGFPVQFMRPEGLSDDLAATMPVLQAVIREFEKRGETFDQVCLLLPCTPLIDADDLKMAAEMFEKIGGNNPVTTVTPLPIPLEWTYRRNDQGELTPIQNGGFRTRSQDLLPAYYDSGAFIFFPIEHIQTAVGGGTNDDFYGYEIPRNKAIDIDDEKDWAFAEKVFAANNM